MHNLISNLRGKGGRVWFQKTFLVPFGGSKDKLAQEVFDTLSKAFAFKALEVATEAYNEKIRPAIDKAANAAKALTDVISNDSNGLSLLIGNFSRAFMAGPGKTAEAGASPAPPAATESTKEKISKELFQAKKLLELGLITKGEYTASLVKTKKLLKEGVTAPAAPEPKDIEVVKAAITSIMGSGSGSDGALSVLLTASAEIQQGLTDYSKRIVAEGKAENELTKAYIKRKILEGYKETKDQQEKPYLNEFLITMIAAALAALAGWVVGKLKGHYNGAATGVAASHPTAAIDKNATTNLLGSIDRGLNASGIPVDAAGKPVPSFEEVLTKYQANLVGPSGNIGVAYNEIKGVMAKSTITDENVKTAFVAMTPFNNAPLAQKDALVASLLELAKMI